jgi:DNA-binding GntR family transcriptional regulator
MVYHIMSTIRNQNRETENGGMRLRPIPTNFTLKDHVYDMLRDAITAMDIYGDDADLKLDERSLADQIGISRTPLREAIARLESDGLVEVVPRKGVYVRRKSLSEILDMIVAWAALESMAARIATERASDAEITNLRRIAGKYNGAGIDSRISEYSEDNIRFHQKILEISKCGVLKDLADGLFLDRRFHLLIDALKLNGITTIYGVPGIPITDLTRKAQGEGCVSSPSATSRTPAMPRPSPAS